MKAMKKLGIEIREDMFYELKTLCVQRRMSMADFTRIALGQSMKIYKDTVYLLSEK
jgi:hypothetical protein